MSTIIEFGPEMLASVEPSLHREWLATNGLGGFASSTILGINTRRYHGLLTAATKPPVGRMVLLSKLEETVVISGERFELAANRYPGVIHPRGYEHLIGFRQDPWPIFRYQAGRIVIEKSVFLVWGENTVVIEYAASGAGECLLELRPLIAFRDYHNLTHANGALNRDYSATVGQITLMPYEGLPTLHMAYSAGEVEPTGDWYFHLEYDRERERGLDYTEDLFNPCMIRLRLRAAETATVIASTRPCSAAEAPGLRKSEQRRRRSIADRAPVKTTLVQRLVSAADQFIVQRGAGKTIIAGYHWFSDWGRDTMIALPGLTLVTGRHEIARQILLESAAHVDRGMLPNRFPDSGGTPEYNTVDATLWFFEGIRSYLAYTGDEQFVIEKLYQVLKSILDWHLAGTRFNIHVDDDGLLFAGEPGVQLTWMDVKIGDWVVTPRTGKPVEVQALWYNALRIMAGLAKAAGDDTTEKFVTKMATLACMSFRAKFWNASAHCLYDVVDGMDRDATIRPNQIFAASLYHTMLTPEQARHVVAAVEKHLLTPTGLRSLAPSDPAYRPHYQGGVADRDSAYHQGTVWPWLLGPFITAYSKVQQYSTQATEHAAGWLSSIEELTTQYCLGTLPEITDAESPYTPRGCAAQAWSVAEILRVLVEDVYQLRPEQIVSAAANGSPR